MNELEEAFDLKKATETVPFSRIRSRTSLKIQLNSRKPLFMLVVFLFVIKTATLATRGAIATTTKFFLLFLFNKLFSAVRCYTRLPPARENVTKQRTRRKGFSGDCVRPNNIYVSTFF